MFLVWHRCQFGDVYVLPLSTESVNHWPPEAPPNAQLGIKEAGRASKCHQSARLRPQPSSEAEEEFQGAPEMAVSGEGERR